VLPIGGLKEKLLAAHRAGLFEVILPKDNEKDLAEVPENLRTAMKMHFVETVDQVLAIALERPLPHIDETVEPISTIRPHRNLLRRISRSFPVLNSHLGLPRRAFRFASTIRVK